MGKKEIVSLKGSYYLHLNVGEALLRIVSLVVGPLVQERCGETEQALLETCQDSWVL